MSKDPIGYGKPPKKHQFKSGTSGNPKGRPKGARSFKAALAKELETKLVLKEAGKPKKVSKLEAVAKRLVTDALNGNPKALTELLRQMNLHLGADRELDPAEQPASTEDQALLARFIARAIAEKEAGNG
ncbi:MAG: hypothetical protein KKC43_05780 [Alphaproteobacteria bacterium]|nr:hypothetical protein [Alphaproteobacteria bacterium]